jgi:dCMP deaminase
VTAKWDQRFLALAQQVSGWSKDPSTQVGAVIVDPDRRVVSLGFNGLPQSMPDVSAYLQDRDEKYSRIIHGEMNALLFAKLPLPTGCSLYTWPMLSCDRCAVHMLQAGIRRFVSQQPSADHQARWGAALDRTRRYIRECYGQVVEL